MSEPDGPMCPGLDKRRYAGILQQFVLAYTRIESLLRELPANSPSCLPVYQPRLPALLADLASLSASVPFLAPPPLRPPQTGDEIAHYLGMRYVVEGSTQGARLIFAHLERSLPQLAGKGFEYWQVQLETSATWPLFCDCLDHAGLDVESLVQGAETAFSVFIDAFASPGPGA